MHLQYKIETDSEPVYQDLPLEIPDSIAVKVLSKKNKQTQYQVIKKFCKQNNFDHNTMNQIKDKLFKDNYTLVMDKK